MAKYKRKEKEALKQLAMDFISGTIYTSNHLENLNDLPSVFMILGFLDKEHLEDIQKDKIVFFYEHLDKAGPIVCNGRPVFFSCQMLNAEDYKIMMEYVEKITSAVEDL